MSIWHSLETKINLNIILCFIILKCTVLEYGSIHKQFESAVGQI